MPTLFEKIWDRHVVKAREDDVLLYIDRHLVHEVTSPQAFAGLSAAGRSVRRPGAMLAVPDHNVPTTPDRSVRIEDRGSREQIQALRENALGAGIALFDIDDPRQGIVHIIGPESGLVQPGITVVCGDSHTGTLGAFGAIAFGIGTSEVEHVLATQTLWQKKPLQMRVAVTGTLGSRFVTPKDVILAVIAKIGAAGGTGYALEFAGRDGPADVDGGPDDRVQHDDRGGGALRPHRPRRGHLRVPEGEAAGAAPFPVGRRGGGLEGDSRPTRTRRGTGRWRSTRRPSSRTSPGGRARRTPSPWAGSFRTRRSRRTPESGRGCGGRWSIWRSPPGRG